MSKVRVLAPEAERQAAPHRPKTPGNSGGSWIIESSGGGGGTAPTIPTAPPVTIVKAETFYRSDHKVEVDVLWTPAANATKTNFSGVAVYLEDPDISSGGNVPLDGSTPLDGSKQQSGQWSPVRVNDDAKSPAFVILDSTMGSTPGASYTETRTVRIYLASYGPNSTPHLVRATDPSPTPNIVVTIGQGRGQGESGMEYAFLVTNPAVSVTTDYNRPDPNYYLTFSYTAPDPSIPIPPGMNNFSGVRIEYVPDDATFDNPQFSNVTNTGIDVPVTQSSGYRSPVRNASAGGDSFRVYFCSEDNNQPLGSHINSLVEGVTPYATATVPPVLPAPDVTSFTINGGASLSKQQTKFVWQLDNSFAAQATLAWNLPTAAAGGARYAGVYIYLVNVTGSVPPLTKFPQLLTGQQSNVDTGFPLDISSSPPIPANDETWTIAAISVSTDGQLADDPKNLAHSPTVTWTLGPPPPYSAGSGQEYAPWVTINAGAHATPTEAMSADGVQTVSFAVGSWTDPTDNRFGGAQVAMVLNGQIASPVFWSVPGAATSFTTPAVPSFGNIGQPVNVDFYIVSDDAQGNKNSITVSTPKISGSYTPSAGQVVSKRAGNFDTSQFQWSDPAGGLVVHQISAQVVQVGSTIAVGGDPTGTFGGSANGQIAVKNASQQLIGWIGQQNAGNASTPGLFGAWFKQLWVGGNDPTTAPIYVDQQGIIEVGGIAAQNGYAYPYISVRSNTGLEVGRIGAQISAQTGLGGDGTGGTPPTQLTAGAWFTQLAVGGSNLSNWNVLIIPHQASPPSFPPTAGGSDFYMRNVYLMSIDYPANASPAGSNPEYKFDVGNSVWMAAGLGGGFKFPGIHIYEVDGGSNNFGATYINRGMVLRAPAAQSYNVLASLVMYNGDAAGGDGTPFWGELDMYSPASPNNRTVVLASGSPTNTAGQLLLADANGNTLFRAGVDGSVFVLGSLQSPSGGAVEAVGLNIHNYGAVIDSTGHWVGQPIGTGGAQPQTPWAQNINGNTYTLSNAGELHANSGFYIGGGVGSGTLVINSSGAFVGAGVNVGSSQGVGCGTVTVFPAPAAGTGGDVSCMRLLTNGILCAANGIWSGSGVQTSSDIYAGKFGINGLAIGWPQGTYGGGGGAANNATATFTSADGKTVTVCGGLIIGIH